MGFLATIIVGLIAGLAASYLMKAKTGLIMDLILGVVGGFVGGWLSSLLLGVNLMSGVNITSIITALLGSVIVIAIYRFIMQRRK